MTAKLAGDSPLKLIMITFVIVIFVALFAWQIEKYLAVTFDSKMQAQIVELDQFIQAENLDAFPVHKYAYLHSIDDRNDPLDVSELRVNFKPLITLDTFMVTNSTRVSSRDENLCYWYLYFPPGMARKDFDFFKSSEAAYVVAGWSEVQNKPIVGASIGLGSWAIENLKRDDFYCQPRELKPNILATDETQTLIELPGINFQFSEFGYSKVKL